MKKLFGIALAAVLAGCATTEKNSLDMRPEASKDKVLSAVDWQNKNDAAITAAMKPEVLAPFVKDAAAAAALLDKVQGAYRTDPMVALQIGGVTQLVMCPKCDKAPAARKVWTAALLKAAQGSSDAYRTMFFLDQLRWCGTKDQSAAIRAIGAKSSEKCVKDFATWVAGELDQAK